VQWEGESSQYDFAFSRFLLTHLPNPLELLRQVYLSLKPGGRMLLEDIRYVALYTATVQHTGADPNIGPSLPSLLQDAGFRHIQCTLVQPVFQRGEGKQISSLTLEFIAESLIHNQLASREAITTYLAELRAFEQDETTLVSLPRIFQVWAVTLRLHLFGPSAKSTDEIDQLTNEYFEHLASYYQAEPGLYGSETMIMTLVLRRR
jgi:SAM-dependent methyltransferase